MPARWGVPAALRLAAVCHVGMIVLLGLLPLVYPRFGWIYWAGVAAVAVLLVYEHWLVRPDDLTRVNVPFFKSTRWSASVCSWWDVADLAIDRMTRENASTAVATS